MKTFYNRFPKPQQAVSPSVWIYYDGVGLVDHSRDEGLAVLAGHLSHFDNVSTGVSPVQVTSHPIHSYATRHLQLLKLTGDVCTTSMCREVKETALSHY